MKSSEKFKVRDKRNKNWFYLDNEYFNGFGKTFGPVGMAIYVALCRFTDNNQKCYPSLNLIANKLGISKRTVINYIKRFENFRIIAIDRRKNKKTGRQLNNVYYLLDKSVWLKPGEIDSLGCPGENNDKSRVNQGNRNNTHKNNTHLSPPTHSLFKNCEVNSKDENTRERILEKIKKYFPDAHIPHDIPVEKIDFLLFKIEQGEVDPSKIRNVVAYLKGLQLEPFPNFVEREKQREEIERVKKEKEKREQEERQEVDYDYNRQQLQLLQEQLKSKIS